MAKKLSDQSITGSVTSSGDITTSGALYVNGASGSEGGQIELAKAPDGSINGASVVVDIYGNKLRFFEKDSPNRGYYLDIPSGASSVGTNLASGTTGAMNWDQQASGKVSGVSASGATIVSRSFTTNGYPVQVTVTGDAENSTAGGWVKLQLYRDSTAIGKIIHVESSAASENVPFALTFIDQPVAGTYVYSLKTASAVASGTMNFGETDGPVLTMVELAGRVGATGATGAPGTGIPSGGTSGQIVRANEATGSPVWGSAAVSGTISTAIGTAAKTVTISNYTLASGDILALKFTNGNSAAAMTLDINAGGAKSILMNGVATTVATSTLAANAIALLYYDGTSFHLMGAQRATVITASSIAGETGLFTFGN